MQFKLDDNRDLIVDGKGSPVPTDQDDLQTFIGECRVLKGDYLFDQDLGIDYRVFNEIGDTPSSRAFLKQEIIAKAGLHNIRVNNVQIESINDTYNIQVFGKHNQLINVTI